MYSDKIRTGTLVAVVANCGYLGIDRFFSSLPGALREAESLIDGALKEVNATPLKVKKAKAEWVRYTQTLSDLDSLQDLPESQSPEHTWAIDAKGNLISDYEEASYSVCIQSCPLYQ